LSGEAVGAVGRAVRSCDLRASCAVKIDPAWVVKPSSERREPRPAEERPDRGAAFRGDGSENVIMRCRSGSSPEVASGGPGKKVSMMRMRLPQHGQVCHASSRPPRGHPVDSALRSLWPSGLGGMGGAAMRISPARARPGVELRLGDRSPHAATVLKLLCFPGRAGASQTGG
jgi:hypothetical protein